jgi:hypothetical protein
MKQLHRPDLYSWCVFDQPRNIDFHGVAWIREGGNVLFDPVPMSGHDLAHLESLGGAAWIVVTNSDHVRDAAALAARFGAKIAGPAGEREGLGVACDRWLGDGEALVEGLTAIALEGSKTPGELALLLGDHTLITGDLVRAHAGGRLDLLPDPKLTDKAAAIASVRRLRELGPDAVLVGDGWPVFRGGREALDGLLARLG